MRLTETPEKRLLLKDIRQKIESGELKVGEKLLSTKELAEEYGVAVQTAHRWLTQLVNEGFLHREKGRGTYVSEKRIMPHAGTVGLIMTCRGDVWGDFAATIAEQLQEAGINTILIETGNGPVDIPAITGNAATRNLIDSRPLTIITHDSELGARLAAMTPKTRIICISGEPLDHFPGDIVRPDFYQGGLIATRHLIERGYTRVAFYKDLLKEKKKNTLGKEIVEMIKGYQTAMREANLQEIIFADTNNLADDLRNFRDKLTNQPPIEAIVVHFDLRAVQFIQEAEKMRIRVPENLAIVSALNTPWSSSFNLTSVDFHYDQIAKKCAQLIIESTQYPLPENLRQSLRFAPTLVMRSSSEASPNS